VAEAVSAPAVSRWLPPDHYEPRHDPRALDRVANDLIAHLGDWRRPTQEFSMDADFVWWCVETLRRIGFVIESRGNGRPGYRMTGWRRPRPYQRLGRVFGETEMTEG
jgi:hypothetical protein